MQVRRLDIRIEIDRYPRTMSYRGTHALNKSNTGWEYTKNVLKNSTQSKLLSYDENER